MKAYKILLSGLVIAGLMFTTSCINGISGNGDVEVRIESIDDFDRLEIDGNFKVFLTQSDRPGLKIEADENLLEYIEVRQVGNKLEIESKRNIFRAKKKDLHIKYTDLQRIELSCALDINGETPIEVKSLLIDCSGAIDLNIDVIAERLRLDVSGAADCDLNGRVKDVSLNISGAGDFNAFGLRAEDVNIDMSGAASARVFATDMLDVEISGAGSVKYKGDPDIRRNISGIGSLRKY